MSYKKNIQGLMVPTGNGLPPYTRRQPIAYTFLPAIIN